MSQPARALPAAVCPHCACLAGPDPDCSCCRLGHLVNWLGRRLADRHVGEPVTDADWASAAVRSVWVAQAERALDALQEAESPVLLLGRMFVGGQPAGL